MLALLKPWRTAGDLKNDGESWADALEKFISSSPVIISAREEGHAKEAITVALSHGLFPMTRPSNVPITVSYHTAAGNERIRLASWQATMKSMAASSQTPGYYDKAL